MRHFCFSDIHGNYKIFQNIKNILQPDDVCYVLGDCADRGKYGWKIIKEVYEDPRFIYIKGNHEDLLVNAMKDYIHCGGTEDFYYMSEDYELYRFNGGAPTFHDWVKDGAHRDWIDKLDSLPHIITYINPTGQIFCMTHAGFTPNNEDDYLWSRNHFNDKWPEGYDNLIMIHGHTPVTHLHKYIVNIPLLDNWGYIHPLEPQAYWYCNNHKIDIDCGTVQSRLVALFDLDTMETQLIGE